MPSQLRKSVKIQKLARDLGLKHTSDPVADIINYCKRKVKRFLSDFVECDNLSDLLLFLAQKSGTFFEEIHSDEDLERIRLKYLDRGEKYFVRLKEELSEEVFGITFRLTNREQWEIEFVSIIDCRGNKSPRAYFTKWHELGHLLVLTDQMRLNFRRTYPPADLKDPEEAIIDIIAGTFGFYDPLIKKCTEGEVSFDAIENLRNQLCPDASWQSSLIGIVKAWPTPCFLVHAKKALKRGERLCQQTFAFGTPVPALRAVKVTSNDSARDAGLIIFENMRIPSSSIISQAFNEGLDYAEREENLSDWVTSDGSRLQNSNVRIKVRANDNSVDALIIPI